MKESFRILLRDTKWQGKLVQIIVLACRGSSSLLSPSPLYPLIPSALLRKIATVMTFRKEEFVGNRGTCLFVRVCPFHVGKRHGAGSSLLHP